MEWPKPLALFPHLHMACDLGAVGGRGENVCNVAAQVLSWGQRRVTGRTRVGGVPERPRGGGAGGGPGQRGQGPGPSKAATPLSSPGSRVVGSPRRLSTPPTPSASGSVPAARLAPERSGTERGGGERASAAPPPREPVTVCSVRTTVVPPPPGGITARAQDPKPTPSPVGPGRWLATPLHPHWHPLLGKWDGKGHLPGGFTDAPGSGHPGHLQFP